MYIYCFVYLLNFAEELNICLVSFHGYISAKCECINRRSNRNKDTCIKIGMHAFINIFFIFFIIKC